jgi:hypothetical protein
VHHVVKRLSDRRVMLEAFRLSRQQPELQPQLPVVSDQQSLCPQKGWKASAVYCITVLIPQTAWSAAVTILASVGHWTTSFHSTLRVCLSLKFFLMPRCFYIRLEAPSPSRSQWPRGLNREPSSLSRTQGSWVRIALEAWMSMCVYSVCRQRPEKRQRSTRAVDK